MSGFTLTKKCPSSTPKVDGRNPNQGDAKGVKLSPQAENITFEALTSLYFQFSSSSPPHISGSFFLCFPLFRHQIPDMIYKLQDLKNEYNMKSDPIKITLHGSICIAFTPFHFKIAQFTSRKKMGSV